MKTVMKILTALAAVAGVIYIVATYGDKIVAWCKKTLESFPKSPCCKADKEIEVEIVVEQETAEEPAAEEVVVEEEAPAAPAAEEPAAEEEPVAEEADFAE